MTSHVSLLWYGEPDSAIDAVEVADVEFDSVQCNGNEMMEADHTETMESRQIGIADSVWHCDLVSHKSGISPDMVVVVGNHCERQRNYHEENTMSVAAVVEGIGLHWQ